MSFLILSMNTEKKKLGIPKVFSRTAMSLDYTSKATWDARTEFKDFFDTVTRQYGAIKVS